MIRRNLRLSVEERFRQLMDLQRFAEELRAGGRPKDLKAIAELEAIAEERGRGWSVIGVRER